MPSAVELRAMSAEEFEMFIRLYDAGFKLSPVDLHRSIALKRARQPLRLGQPRHPRRALSSVRREDCKILIRAPDQNSSTGQIVKGIHINLCVGRKWG